MSDALKVYNDNVGNTHEAAVIAVHDFGHAKGFAKAKAEFEQTPQVSLAEHEALKASYAALQTEHEALIAAHSTQRPYIDVQPVPDLAQPSEQSS